MTGFQHHSPPLRLHCGPSALAALPGELQRLRASRAFVVCGASMSRPGQGLDQIRELLGDALAGSFTGVRPHSPLDSVLAAGRQLAEACADVVIALGGGSAIVTARAAGILAAEGENIEALYTRVDAGGGITSPRLGAPKLPQIVIPTTPTTAMAKAGSAVHDERSGARLALFDPKTRAQAVLIDGRLLGGAPAGLVQAAALNAFTMAVEGLESPQADPLSDALLMHAVRLLAQHLRALKASPDDVGARIQLALAALMCGQGTDTAGGGVASVLGHAIGPRCDAANGIVNAIVLPHTMHFNSTHTASRQWTLRAALALPGAPDADPQPAVRALTGGLGLPQRLRDIGIRREDFAAIAAEAGRDFFLRRNPRPVPDASTLVALLEACW